MFLISSFSFFLCEYFSCYVSIIFLTLVIIFVFTKLLDWTLFHNVVISFLVFICTLLWLIVLLFHFLLWFYLSIDFTIRYLDSILKSEKLNKTTVSRYNIVVKRVTIIATAANSNPLRVCSQDQCVCLLIFLI